MAIDSQHVVRLVQTAGRLVGLRELLHAGGFHPGQQTDLKRILRELVKSGSLVRGGKRFGPVGEKPKQKSGPAWTKQPPSRNAPQGRPQNPARSQRPGKPDSASRSDGARRSKETARAEHVRVIDAPAKGSAKPKGPPRTISTRGKTVTGSIKHHRDGFAFVRPVVGDDSEDVFIPPEEAKKALDGDQVLVEVVPGRGGKTQGRVVEVTSRTRQMVIGTYTEDGKRAWVEPRETTLGAIRVPKTQLARPGDVVKVRLGIGGDVVSDPSRLTGEVAGSLGAEADHSVEVLSVAFAKGFHDEFPPEVMDEADQIPLEVGPKEAKGERRRDLRSMSLITIDGKDARDFDDAVFCEPHRDGTRLVVAIADVSHYVREGMALDAEALRRATSVYLPGRVLPMLPERLSNGICSLKPDVDRLCMVADMVIDGEGQTVATEIYPAVMKSAARCTYTEVHDVLAGKNVPGRVELKPLFAQLLTLSKTLTHMRLRRGAIDFDLPEHKVELGDDGLPVRMVQRERWESHRLIEECMLAANEAVARFFREQELPTVNRFHDEPDEDRLQTFLNLLGAYGVTVPGGKFTSHAFNQVLAQLEGHPEQRALNQLGLRSMAQAVYSSQESGHYGLGATDYLHFTSPIRRYPDLLVHRLLKALWARGKKRPPQGALEVEAEQLEAMAVQCSERERAAMQVEREVNQLYACLLLKDHVGEEHQGTVTGLTENGFFVQLDELMVDGFVKGESVYPDFEFDQATYRMTFGNGHVLKIGARCRVLVLSVNLERKQIDFSLSELAGEALEALEAPVRRERSSGEQSRGPRKYRSQDRGGRFGPRRENQERRQDGSRRESPGEGRRMTQRGPARSDREPPKRGQRSAPPSGLKVPDGAPSDRGGHQQRRPQRDARDARPSRKPERIDRFSPQARFAEAPGRAKVRREPPPPQPWDQRSDEPQADQKEAGPKKFDLNATLDRLRRQRSGR